MVKGRKEEIFVAFLFEVMRCYGVHEKLVIKTD